MRPRTGHMRRWRLRGDAGFTLSELLVAMGIFTVVIAVSTAALRVMTDSTVRVTQANDARTEGDRLYNLLDKQAPYASAINPAGTAGGSWWIEFVTVAQGRAETCHQYRLDTATRLLRTRSWRPGNAASVTPWSTVLTDARARTGTGAPPPFRMIPAGTDLIRQRLVIALDIAPIGTPVVPIDSTFVARNTASDTVTNSGTTRTCPEVARS